MVLCPLDNVCFRKHNEKESPCLIIITAFMTSEKNSLRLSRTLPLRKLKICSNVSIGKKSACKESLIYKRQAVLKRRSIDYWTSIHAVQEWHFDTHLFFHLFSSRPQRWHRPPLGRAADARHGKGFAQTHLWWYAFRFVALLDIAARENYHLFPFSQLEKKRRFRGSSHPMNS